MARGPVRAELTAGPYPRITRVMHGCSYARTSIRSTSGRGARGTHLRDACHRFVHAYRRFLGCRLCSVTDLASTITIASGAQNDHSFVRVSNTGMLIPPELVDSLFHPFTRLDDRTRHDGFGLGLALVASIASIHDARIEAIAGAAGGLDITVRFIQATSPIGVDGWASEAFS